MKLLFVSSLLLLSTAQAQFACTFSGATDEDGCLAQTDDSGASCVWCALSQFGFCVAESQAEAMEQALPGVQCDRAKPADDDAAPTPTDDEIAPTDDSIPDNYWECLKVKDATTCGTKDGCTWCNTKAGFGLCLSGPSADSASKSAWFDCPSTDIEDPLDTSCMTTYVQDPTEDACKGAVDVDGGACEWCDLQGMSQLCLTKDQAQMAQLIGATCDDTKSSSEQAQDPYDTACVMAYLQDPTENGCKGAVDQDGGSCEWCDLAGMGNLCLTDEQAQMAAALGVTCEENSTKESKAQDPYDTSCAVAYLQDPTEDGCKGAVDEDGAACEWCDLDGVGNMCLTDEQAKMAQALGVTCDGSTGFFPKISLRGA